MKHGTPVRIAATLALGGAAGIGAMSAAHADAGPAGYGLPQLGNLKLYPMAGHGADLLSNTIGTNLSGLPVSTGMITQYFETGLPLSQVPVVGDLMPAPAAAPGVAAASEDPDV